MDWRKWSHCMAMRVPCAFSSKCRNCWRAISRPKGSVALDGVSLTVNEVEGRRFGVNLIPHNGGGYHFVGQLTVGKRLNLEVDQLARYVERLLGR